MIQISQKNLMENLHPLKSQKSQAPKQKRPQTAVIKKKKRNESDEESDNQEIFGTLIQEKKSQLIPIIDKSEFKYFKPWIQEPSKPLPKWAEDMQDKPLRTILEKDLKMLKTQDELLKKQIEFNATQLTPDQFFDPKHWRVNDILLRRSGADPNKKSKLQQEQDHGKRLAEVYTKFLDTYERYKDKMSQEGVKIDELEGSEGVLGQPFDPKKARERINQKLLQLNNQNQQVGVVQQDNNMISTSQPDIQNVQENKSQNQSEKDPNKEQLQIKQDQEHLEYDQVEFEVESDDDNNINQHDNFEFEEVTQLQGTEAMFSFDEVEEIPSNVSPIKHIIAVQEQKTSLQIEEEEHEENRLSLMSEFAKQLEKMVKKECNKDLSQSTDISQVIVVSPKIQQEKQEVQSQHESSYISSPPKRNFAQEKRDRQQVRINKLLKINSKDPTKPISKLDTKIDNWISNFDKKLQDEEQITKTMSQNYLEHQQEFKETMKEFEDALKYYENYEQYEKDMKKYVKKLDEYEAKQAANTLSQAQNDEQIETDFNFVNYKKQNSTTSSKTLQNQIDNSQNPLTQKQAQKINVDLSAILSQSSFINYHQQQNSKDAAILSPSRTLVFQKLNSIDKDKQMNQNQQNIQDDEMEDEEDLGGVDSPFVLTPTRLLKLSIPLEGYQEDTQ
eukprot:403376599